MPDETFTFADLIRGEVTVEGTEIGDFVIAKPDGSPIFHLSNVVDDAEMAITHIIRGEDHLPNVPRHIALFHALGHEPPVYAHLPLILNPDGSKMSKRKPIEGLEPYVRVFREKGYLPEALVNYLALLGWSPGDDREQLTLDQLTEVFSLEKVNKSGARFDLKKLNDLNGQYIRRLPDEEFERQLRAQLADTGYPVDADAALLRKTIPLVRERLSRFEEAPGYMRFFFEDVDYDASLLKAKDHTAEGSRTMLAEVLKWLERLPETEFTARILDQKTRATAEQEPYNWKARHLFMIVRVAVTGSTATPPLFETMEVLGKATCVRRLKAALGKLAQA
jgi:glutamyl-tRNA synthetase